MKTLKEINRQIRKAMDQKNYTRVDKLIDEKNETLEVSNASQEPCLLYGQPFPKNGNDICPDCFINYDLKEEK